MESESAGINDVDGKAVLLGDIVEFWACMFHGFQAAQFKNSQKCGVRLADVIVRRDDESPIPGHTIKTYFAMSPVEGAGIFAKKLDGVCKVIGHFPQDAKLLVSAVPHWPQSGPECDKIIERLCKSPLIIKAAP